jgi:hypothetical protein
VKEAARMHNATQVADASARLRALARLYTGEDMSRIVRALCQAGIHLLGADKTLAADLRHELQASTGLSAEMIEWGLNTTFSTVRPDVLDALAHEVTGTRGLVPVPAKLVVVVLAGNVFSAAVRAVFLPLLSGAPVLVKGATSDNVLPFFLLRAMRSVDPEIASRCEVVGFARDDQDAVTALLAHADVVSIYGDDHTLETLGAQTRPGAQVLRHGHGVSVSYVCADAMCGTATIRDAAQRVALDVAAYDQRGCLSPQFVYVQRGGAVGAREFARVMFEETLPELARLLPPGAAGLADRANALQWRAAAQVRGELFEGHTFAVSYEARHEPRPSPGGRLVGVYECDGPDDLARALVALAPALKCVGVAGPRDQRLRLAQSLRLMAAARVCRAGEMQTPPFHAYADGQPPLAGLLSFIEAH